MTTHYELDHQISCIDSKHVRANFVASYLIESAGELAFVDTGSHLSVPNLLQVLDDKGLSTQQVRYIFLTHIHLDHAGGAGTLLQHLPNAKVVVHQKGADHLIDPRKLKQRVIDVYGEPFFKQHLGDIIAIDESKVIIAQDKTMTLGRRELSLIDTPGHARHHYCIYDKTSQGIFSGDTLGVSYQALNTPEQTFIFPPTSPSQFEPEVWQTSIDKLATYQPKYAYLTHFNRLAINNEVLQQLKQRIRDICQITTKIAQTRRDKEVQKTQIKKQLRRYLSAALSQNTSLNEVEKMALLKDDIDISTQGLMVWLSYQHRLHQT